MGSLGVRHFFKFTLEHPVWVRLTAGSNNDGLSLSWELFDSPSLTSDISDSLYDRGTSHERIAFSPRGYLFPGTYYLRVTPEESGEQRYALQFAVFRG